MKQVKQGYVLVLTLVIISLSMIIVTYLSNRGLVFRSFSQTMIEREKAEQLAHGGISIALAQLAQLPPKEQEEKPAPKPAGPQTNQKEQPSKAKITPESMGKFFFKSLFLNLNQWQQFTLKKEREGIDGKISICLMSEDGKININQLYDFEKNEFTVDKKIMQDFFESVKKQMGGENLFESVSQFLKKRGRKLDDVTQLLAAKDFESFKSYRFYDPESKEKKLYLTDLFTIWSHDAKAHPLLFSPSVTQLFSFPKADTEKRTKLSDELAKNFSLESKWESDWDKKMKPLYGKEFKGLDKIVPSLLATKFEPMTFSVLSYGTVGRTTFRLFAIIERVIAPDHVKVDIRTIYVV